MSTWRTNNCRCIRKEITIFRGKNRLKIVIDKSVSLRTLATSAMHADTFVRPFSVKNGINVSQRPGVLWVQCWYFFQERKDISKLSPSFRRPTVQNGITPYPRKRTSHAAAHARVYGGVLQYPAQIRENRRRSLAIEIAKANLRRAYYSLSICKGKEKDFHGNWRSRR